MWTTLCFFKVKAAYEMRIRDWSSDVCSSDLDAERAGQRQQVVNEDLVLGIGGDVPDEGAVDLHHVDRQRLQMMEGGAARAEIVQRHLAAERPQRRDEPRGLVDVLTRRRHGDLDDQTGDDVAGAREAGPQASEPSTTGAGTGGGVDERG